MSCEQRHVTCVGSRLHRRCAQLSQDGLINARETSPAPHWRTIGLLPSLRGYVRVHSPSVWLTDHAGDRQTYRSESVITCYGQTRLQKTIGRSVRCSPTLPFPIAANQEDTPHARQPSCKHSTRTFACSPGPLGTYSTQFHLLTWTPPCVGFGLTPLVTSASQACSRPPQGCGPSCGHQRCGSTRPTPQDGRSPYGLHPAPSPSSMRSSPCLPPPGLSCLRISPVSIPHCPTLHPGDPDHMTASHLSRHALLFIMICPILTPARDRDGRLKHWQQNMPVQCLPMGYPSQV